MNRKKAREMAVHIVFALPYAPVGELLDERLERAFYERLAGEDPLFEAPPGEEEAAYITKIVRGVEEHAAELDGYIERLAKGWKFSRIPRVSVAIMQVCMFEVLYMPEIPDAAAFNAAVEIAKKYEPPEVVSFLNGILGSFSRKELPQ